MAKVQASQITGFMTQFVRSGANFLRKILRQMLDLLICLKMMVMRQEFC